MDNVSFHKSKEVKEYISKTDNNILYVPPYSPQFNPIELVFSKMKHNYRKLSVKSDNIENKVKESISSINSKDLFNYFKNVENLIRS